MKTDDTRQPEEKASEANPIDMEYAYSESPYNYVDDDSELDQDAYSIYNVLIPPIAPYFW